MDKYKVTTAELFKIKMQLRAQINHLRRTYDEIVVPKLTPEKKHYPNHFQISSIIQPFHQKSIKKQTLQRKHYSPNLLNTSQSSLSLGKKHFRRKNQHQDVRKFNAAKRKSSSYLLNIGKSSSMINIKNQSTGYNIGKRDNSVNKIQRPSKKIFYQKHQFNNKLI